MADLVTLAQAKAFLRLTGDTATDDDNLTLIIGWASARIEHELSTIGTASITETARATGRQFILQRTPVTAVTSLTGVLDSQPAVEASDVVVVNAAGGVITVASGSTPVGLYTVVYTAGYGATPTGVDGATLALIRHWWNQSQAHASSVYGESGFVPDFRELPNTVRNMLAVTPAIGGVA